LPFFQNAAAKRAIFSLCGIPCPAILIVNYLNLLKYADEMDFGTDIANYFRIKRPLTADNP
jgi:hypothetical protein